MTLISRNNNVNTNVWIIFDLRIIPVAIVDESILFLNSHRSVSDTRENTPLFIHRYIKFLACFTYAWFLDLSCLREGAFT